MTEHRTVNSEYSLLFASSSLNSGIIPLGPYKGSFFSRIARFASLVECALVQCDSILHSEDSASQTLDREPSQPCPP